MDSPVLPPDLERELFETAAMMYPQEIPTLLRVARRVLSWIEPLLYRVSTRSPEFFHKAVRHLGLKYISREEARRILRLCKGIVDLALEQSLVDPDLIPILAEMRVQWLAVSLTSLFGEAHVPDLKHSLFASITHLDVFDNDAETVGKVCAQIPTLPALTHLSVHFGTPRPVLMRVLKQSPRLELLLIMWSAFYVNPYQAARIPHVYDVRFVIGQYSDYWAKCYWAHWEACAKGLPNF
ncbi:hypothetical protein B0H13DRAFT_2153713 [Mycena leptocephala]|nr:hypothetical protein B0H13DRAFT_2153713 [Mycena leptocephala]